MELEYRGIIKTDDMVLSSIDQRGNGSYVTRAEIPPMGQEWETDQVLGTVHYSTGTREQHIGASLDEYLSSCQHVTMRHVIDAAGYNAASGRILGPVHGNLEIETEYLPQVSRGDAYTLDMMPVMDYMAGLGGPTAQMFLSPIQEMTIEGDIPDEVVAAYERFLGDRSSENVQAFSELMQSKQKDIHIGRVNLVWEEKDDLRNIGFGPAK